MIRVSAPLPYILTKTESYNFILQVLNTQNIGQYFKITLSFHDMQLALYLSLCYS
jgi:hypothetical protein